MRPGEQLRDLRNRLGITTREVEDYSRTIAESEGNEDFYISNAWLTQLENKNSIPSIYKLYSLSIIYRTRFADLLSIFGVELERSTAYQLSTPLEKTHLASIEPPDPRKAVMFPVRFDKGFSLEKTSLISRMVEIWGEVPIALIQHLDVRHGLYGYIGLEDLTLYPLLRPGSFVQIDPRMRKVQPFRSRTEADRPIYFVELREGYACAWCDLQDGHLLLLPHPLSPSPVRRVSYGTDAEIVGQVCAVAMRLIDPPAPPPDAAKLPRRV
jgi:transcriptional regulator with XRE-family HTH domain